HKAEPFRIGDHENRTRGKLACSNASAESILMYGFGTPVFSHFCPEAFGRRKRAAESGGSQLAPAPGMAESSDVPVEGKLIKPYHRKSDTIYLNAETLGWG